MMIHQPANESYVPMSVEWYHTTQVKGQSTGRRQGPAEGLALQATKAWEKRDEVFIVLFDYSGVVMVR